MLLTCFSTDRSETTSIPAIAVLERPSAISASTSRSRAVSVPSPSARRLAPSSWVTTCGSRAVPPVATRFSASTNSSTSATRSLSRYPTPAAATGRRVEQVGRVPGLDVLGEHQHPGRGVVAADSNRGAQPLVGVARWHPHVHYGGVWVVFADSGQQIL